MPELRKDPIIGRWVIIATERAKRPDEFSAPCEQPVEGDCPFCRGNERQTPPEISAVRESASSEKNTPDWRVRVIPSIKPMLRIEGRLDRRGQGIYDMISGIGAHEVVIETPEHINNIADLPVQQIDSILGVYIERISDLSKDARFKYVLAFKNHGRVAGAGRIRHSRSQLIATPVTPKRVKEELAGARRYFDYHERCVFCDMVKQELASGERLIIDIDGFVAVAPFASRFPFEIWILPKEHSCDFISLAKTQRQDLARIIKTVLLKLKIGVGDPPYNYILHTAPFRRAKSGYWRTINQDFHWHIEIMPRLTRVAGFEWGTGFYICSLPPEEAAGFLRKVEVPA